MQEEGQSLLDSSQFLSKATCPDLQNEKRKEAQPEATHLRLTTWIWLHVSQVEGSLSMSLENYSKVTLVLKLHFNMSL